MPGGASFGELFILTTPFPYIVLACREAPVDISGVDLEEGK
jgi:hypothetical protein